MQEDPKEFQVRRYEGKALIASGFIYYETAFRGAGVGWLAVLLFFGIIGGTVFSFMAMSKSSGAGLAFCLILAGGSLFAFLKLNRPDPESMRTKRMTVFCGDGRILHSNRRAAEPAVVPVEGITIVDIQAIAMVPSRAQNGAHATMPDGFTNWPVWQIDFHLKDGRTVCHAHQFANEEYARMVAIQLRLAMEELVSHNISQMISGE